LDIRKCRKCQDLRAWHSGNKHCYATNCTGGQLLADGNCPVNQCLSAPQKYQSVYDKDSNPVGTCILSQRFPGCAKVVLEDGSYRCGLCDTGFAMVKVDGQYFCQAQAIKNCGGYVMEGNENPYQICVTIPNTHEADLVTDSNVRSLKILHC
jgi:hypothetical protein